MKVYTILAVLIGIAVTASKNANAQDEWKKLPDMVVE